MTNMTLAIPEDLKRIMDKHADVKWSEVARQALWEKARKLDLMDKLLANRKMTEEDALRIGREINKGIARRHRLVK